VQYIMTEMTTDTRTVERLDAMERTLESLVHKLNKLYVAVVGDETLDQEGYLQRLKKLEKQVHEHQILKYKLMGAFVGGGAIWTILWEAFKKLVLKS